MESSHTSIQLYNLTHNYMHLEKIEEKKMVVDALRSSYVFPTLPILRDGQRDRAGQSS